MTSFLHDLPDDYEIDNGLPPCPNCGRSQSECECTEDDMNRWAHDVLYPDDCPCHDLEEIWDDGVGQRCCFCLICGKEQIIRYETEEDDDDDLQS